MTTESNLISPSELARVLHLSTATVYGWIRAGRIAALREQGRIQIPISQAYLLERLAQGGQANEDRPYTPDELKHYGEWHEALDQFTWLMKSAYTSREDLKHRRFRLDSLFAAYILDNGIKTKTIRRALLTTTPRRWGAIAEDLRRGWYNELAFAMPTKPASLGLTFADVRTNIPVSERRFAFPSWPIVQAYYAVYFFLRSVALQKQPLIRLAEHAATLRVFKHNVAGALDGILWCFPLNLASGIDSSTSGHRSLRSRFPHWAFAYARHPREPWLSPMECIARLLRGFRRHARTRGGIRPYNLFDFLHDFRVWVNYQDIDSMLRLWGGGYRTFLDMNLGAILFFVGGIAELAFIATKGQRAYVRNLQAVYEMLTENNAELRRSFLGTGVFQRHQIFTQLGLVNEPVNLRVEIDRHAVQVQSGPTRDG